MKLVSKSRKKFVALVKRLDEIELKVKSCKKM